MPIPPRYALLAEMRLEQAQADALKRDLRVAAAGIEKDILKAGASGNPMTLMQLKAQQSAVNSVLRENFLDINKSLEIGQKRAALEASKVVSTYENELLKLAIDPDAMKLIAASEARRAATGIDALVTRMTTSKLPLSARVYNTQLLSLGMVDTVINQALVSGWDSRRLAKEMRALIDPKVPGGVSYAANRLARSEINNAFHASAAKRYRESGLVNKVAWNTSSSHPENDVCDEYRDASPFLVNKVPGKPHPFCYCYITPVLDSEEEFKKKLLAGEYGEEPWVKDVSPDKLEKLAGVRSLPPSPNMPKIAADIPKTSPRDELYAAIREVEDSMSNGTLVYGTAEYEAASVERYRLWALRDNKAAIESASRRYEIMKGRQQSVDGWAENFGVTREEFLRKTVGVLQKEVDEIPISVMVPQTKMKAILDSGGVKSVYETGKRVGGMNGKAYMEARDGHELLAYEYNSSTPVTQRPISGFFRDPEGRRKPPDQYGDVEIVLKDQVKDRSTVTAGDSLDTPNVLPSDAARIDERSIYEMTLQTIYEQGTAVGNKNLTYVEAQIHGGVSLSDISEIRFAKEPTAAIKKQLEKEGIPWSVVEQPTP